ncbi:hypothetical protein Tco_1387719 [Tanacetum coccineum]
MVESPILEQVSSKYKLKLKYGGYFRLAKNSCTKRRYCYGHQKSIYIDTCLYHLRNLIEEAITRYPSNRDLVLSILFVGKYAARQSFIELDSDEKFKMMLDMHEVEKEVTLYVTTENNAPGLNERQQR